MPVSRGRLALVGGRLIDGNGGMPVRDAVVVIDGNRIAAAGPPGIEIPNDAETIRCDGKTILPGLIDSHVHVPSSSGGQASPRTEYSPETRAAKLKSWLGFGVTTIMDMGSNAAFDQLRSDLDTGKLVGPRLFGVKYAITSPGGHPLGLARELRIADHDDGLFVVANADEARAAVRKAAAGKPDGLKIHHTRSQFPGTSCLDCDLEKHAPDTLRALIDEGHKQGLRVFAHIAWPSEAREVIEAGADTLAHTITHAETGTRPVWELMAERGVPMETTLTRIEAYFVFKIDPFLREKLRGKVPDAILDSLGMPESISRRRNDSEEVEGDARRILEIAMANTKRAHKLGVKIVLGTDSGGPGGLHGAVVPREMELIHECGLTPMQTITAATKSAAEVIGQGAALGTVEKGKLADIVVVAGDPLRDISDMRKIDLVIRDGVVFDRNRLALATPEPVR
jgi:imidazolonepropionase-like amidohydrolase